MKTKPERTWEAFTGVRMVNIGKRANGKPRVTIVVTTIIAMSESDAKAMAKANPRLKCVEQRVDPLKHARIIEFRKASP